MTFSYLCILSYINWVLKQPSDSNLVYLVCSAKESNKNWNFGCIKYSKNNNRADQSVCMHDAKCGCLAVSPICVLMLAKRPIIVR